MIPRRLLFVSLLLALFLSLQSIPTTKCQVGTVSQGLGQTVILGAKAGKVRVYLPPDVAAGDTISGTVIAEPAGKTDNDRAKNARELNGLVIEVGSQRWPVSGGVIQRLVIPATLVRPPEIILLDEKGKKVYGATLPMTQTPNINTRPNFVIPTLGQSGQPLLINGPFDGDSSNTKINIGGTDAKVIAESPRSAVVETPKNVVGPTNVNVNENGNTATGNFRALKIDLTAPKTSLLKGESTELHVEVQGLQGITQPVQVQLQNQTPSNINLSGGNTQTIPIQPSQVTTGGTFNWSTKITGTGSGGFNVTGTIPSTPAATPSPSPVTSKPATPTPSPAPSTGATGAPTKQAEVTASPPLPPISSPISTPEVRPATEEEIFYASFAEVSSHCCDNLISNGVLTFQDDKGNSFTIDHDKLKMVVDGKTYEWQFSQDGKPFLIEWMFCHLKDNQIVSQGTQVMAQRLQGGKTTESGGSTNISMAGPYRKETTTRTHYGFQFTGLKVGTNNKEYAVSFTMDEETCKWSFQLFAEDKTVSATNGPPGSPSQIYQYLMGNNNLRGPNSYAQGQWWSNMYRVAGEIVSWQAWLAEHPNAEQSQALSNAFDVWRLMVKNAIDNLYGSASAADKQLFDQMRALLSPTSLSPAQMNQVFWKFSDLWMRYREGVK